MAKQEKARYWVGVLYPENMCQDWQEKIGDIVQLPFAYCIHSKDKDTKSEHRKDHVHLILAWPGPTTYNSAFSVFDRLSASGKKALNKIESIVYMRNMYDYLIHDTVGCRKAGKELYSASDRVTGNNFDIGCYEQLTETEKRELIMDMFGFIRDNGLVNFMDLFEMCAIQDRSRDYIDLLRGNSTFFQRLLDGMYQRKREESK